MLEKYNFQKIEPVNMIFRIYQLYTIFKSLNLFLLILNLKKNKIFISFKYMTSVAIIIYKNLDFFNIYRIYF